MAHCKDVKKGESYKCNSCGFELEAKTDCNCDDNSCDSNMECCGQSMSKM